MRPGIGKTTLLATFAREASPGGTCSTGAATSTSSCRSTPSRASSGGWSTRCPTDVLMAHAAACGGDLLRLSRMSQARIALPVPAGDDDTARHRLFDAVFDVIERAAAIAPLILVLDDLHWAEPAALQLLRYLVRNLGATPGPVRPRLPRARRARPPCLPTSRPPRRRGSSCTASTSRSSPHWSTSDSTTPPATTSGRSLPACYAETAGNPLFAEHLLRHWIETSQIEVDDERGVTGSRNRSGAAAGAARPRLASRRLPRAGGPAGAHRSSGVRRAVQPAGARWR